MWDGVDYLCGAPNPLLSHCTLLLWCPSCCPRFPTLAWWAVWTVSDFWLRASAMGLLFRDWYSIMPNCWKIWLQQACWALQLVLGIVCNRFSHTWSWRLTLWWREMISNTLGWRWLRTIPWYRQKSWVTPCPILVVLSHRSTIWLTCCSPGCIAGIHDDFKRFIHEPIFRMYASDTNPLNTRKTSSAYLWQSLSILGFTPFKKIRETCSW